MKKYIFHLLFLSIFSNISLFSQSLSFNGQFSSIGNYEEIRGGHILTKELDIRYLPEISFLNNVNQNSYIEFHWSYYIKKNLYTTGLNLDEINRYKHRLWIRYVNNTIDFRLGLQKLAFGPGYILRPLSWFDTIDYTDITRFTQGVEAMRFIYTPSNALSVWTWAMSSHSKMPSYGGRIELSNYSGDWGITYHRNLNSSKEFTFFEYGLIQQIIASNNNFLPFLAIRESSRLGFDYRYDGAIGFWMENSLCLIDKYDDVGIERIYSSMIGFDYTIPVLDGIYLMSETMYSSVLAIDDSYFDITNTVVNLDFPIDFLNTFSLVLGFNLDNNDYYRSYHLLRFISVYDDFSVEFSTNIKDGHWFKNIQATFVYNY